jgi:NTP pyrophosphatase (non-canonical NTP hydrolase)
MQFSEYQKSAATTDQLSLAGAPKPADPILVPLLGLAGETGTLLSEYKKVLLNAGDREYYAHFVKEELGDILWYMSAIADKFGLSLDDIAFDNLVKCHNRWPSASDHLHDEGFYVLDRKSPPDQRLPRNAVIRFQEFGEGADLRLKTTIIEGTRREGETPNYLTDNAYDDDGYRYHDIFHLSYAAILGWSPVFRKFLVPKKRDGKADEVEDGGRAKVIEEGVAHLVFSYAGGGALFDGATSVPSELLRIIKNMTAHLEVSIRSQKDWQRAIQEGYRVFRLMRAAKGGDVTIDLDARTIEYSPLPAA